MIANAQQIREFIDMGYIEDASIDDVGPSSIDVHLGNKLLVEMWNKRKIVCPATGDGPAMEEKIIDENGIVLTPGEFVLGSVYEVLRLPPNISAEFRLCSTSARCGLEHALAVWIDPGFCGRITLELKNSLRYNDMLLRRGDRIGQLIFHIHEATDSPYAGSYRGDFTTQEAKAH
jgi:dCTP deaminase